jgi:hypothetical protein
MLTADPRYEASIYTTLCLAQHDVCAMEFLAWSEYPDFA